MIIWAHPADGAPYRALVDFIAHRIWGKPKDLPAGTAMAVVDGGNLLGACLFHNWHRDNGVIELTAASVSARWLSRPVLREIFGYAFGQLGCQAVVMRVAPENTRMCRIASAFGFKRYDVPRLRGRDKAEAIFVIGDDDWRAGRFSQES